MAVSQAIAPHRFALLRWESAPGWVRPLVFIASIGVAYLFSFADLFKAMTYNTPLAYLGLVPILALLIGMWRYRRHAVAPAKVTAPEAVIGGVIVVIGGAIAVAGPLIVGAYAYWMRLDLLSLPFFAIGMLYLLYGMNALSWSWPAVAFSFLVWPLPYQHLLGAILTPLANLSAAGVAWATHLLPLGASVSPDDPSTFQVIAPGGLGEISVGSACAGFETISTFCFLGGALLLIARPRFAESWKRTGLRMALWLAFGLALALVGNVARILIVIAFAHARGMDFAFSAIHPYAGIVMMMLALVVMIALLRPFGLVLPGLGTEEEETRPFPWREIGAGGATAFLLVLGLTCIVRLGFLRFEKIGQWMLDHQEAWAAGPLRIVTFLVVGGLIVFLAFHLPSEAPPTRDVTGVVVTAVILVCVLASSITNTTIASVQVSDSSGVSFALNDYEQALPGLEGVQPQFDSNVPWMVQYYGQDSVRNLYHYPTPDENSDLWAIVDTTPARNTLNVYSLWSCYAYHGFPEVRRGSAAIGHGVTATVINWYDPDTHEAWSSVSWIQPVRRGNGLVHQRVALNAWFVSDRGEAKAAAFFAPYNERTQRDAVAALNTLWPATTSQ